MKVLNQAEKEIGLMCRENARNKDAAERFLNRYERKVRDKALDNKKQSVREQTEELRWN